jgi:murein L,D-transpeptidase YafK
MTAFSQLKKIMGKRMPAREMITTLEYSLPNWKNMVKSGDNQVQTFLSHFDWTLDELNEHLPSNN